VAVSGVGSGGAWKDILPGTAVGAGGAWKSIQGMWVGAGGAWKQFFQNRTIAFSDQSISDSFPGSATCGYSVSGNAEGTAGFIIQQIHGSTSTLETYITPLADYSFLEAKAVLSSGTTPSGSAMNTFFDLASNSPAWSIASFSGNIGSVFVVTIREKANTSNTVSHTISLSASA
jgi:hypothetical protein